MIVNDQVSMFVRYAADVDDSSIADTYVLAWDAALQKHIYVPNGGGGGCSCTWTDIQPTAPTTLTGYGITLTDNNMWLGNGSNVPTAVVLSGDVTTTNTGVVTIANDAVTYPKIQEMPTVTLLGNPTGGTANPTGVILDASLQFTGGTTLAVTNPLPTGTAVGDLAKWNGSAWAVFAKGTANQVLKVNSGATDIAYETIELLPTPTGDTRTLRSFSGDWTESSMLLIGSLVSSTGGIAVNTSLDPGVAIKVQVSSGSSQTAIHAINANVGYAIYAQATLGNGVYAQAGLNGTSVEAVGSSSTTNGFTYSNSNSTPTGNAFLYVSESVNTVSININGLNLFNAKASRFYELTANGSAYVAIKAVDDMGANPSYTLILPDALPGSTQALVSDSSGNMSFSALGTGDVVGPASATDTAIAIFDGTTGKLIKNSGILIASDINLQITNAGSSRFYELTANGSAYVGIKAVDDMGANPSYTLILPDALPGSTQALVSDSSGNMSFSALGTGDVVGPASATDTAIALFDTTTGKLIKNSNIGITSNVISALNTNGNLELTPNGAGFQRFYQANVNSFNYFDNTTTNGPANKVWLIGRTNSDASGDTLRNAWTINGGLTAIVDATRQGEINFEVANNTSMLTALQLNSSGGVLYSRLRITNGTNYIDLDLPSLSGNWAMTLPTDGGSTQQVMTTDGSGNTSWVEKGQFKAVDSMSGNANLALVDASKLIVNTSGSNYSRTILANATVAFPIGTTITFDRSGAGTLTVTADTGVTLNGASAGSNTVTTAATLIKIDTDTWVLRGDIA